MESWKKLHRRSIRLQNYDYTQAGAYFVTLCTQDRRHLFGEIFQTQNEFKFTLSEGGKIAERCWNEIPQHYPNVELDEFVIMPNHVHGVIVITHTDEQYGDVVGANNHSPLQPTHTTNQHPRGTSKTVGAIVRGYKIGVTKWFRKNTQVRDVWQRNYYENIVRNNDDLNRIRKYINENPFHWNEDDHYS